MLYKDFRKEVQTNEIIEFLLDQGHEIVLPRVSDNKEIMELYLIFGQKDLQESDYGILEPIPQTDRLVTPDSLDLVLSPGVGFTPDGYRIGYGGGFYDKMLEGLKDIFVCALAFDCQMVETLPIEAHDQRLNMIITELKVYTI
jgi:5-formyltetrahydrofolate cyclo-ligase